jgi:hypothetical protein
MYSKLVSGARKCACAAGAALLLGASLAVAADGADDAMANWLGREITINTTSLGEDFPAGGKLTLTYDDEKNVVRLCTRQPTDQVKPWRNDLAQSCGVTLTFKKGTRYCSVEDLKTDDAETLVNCHRLRSEEITLKPANAQAETHDLLVFLVKSEPGKPVIAILVDSPSRVTSGGAPIIIGGHGKK